jgi:acyl transferase domain-containing protein
MKKRKVFLFSGEGSQYYQMGRPLYERNPVFRKSMIQMNEMVNDISGISVTCSLYGDRSKVEPLSNILLSHPAIFMVEVAMARTLMSEGIEPDLTLGASLGSFAAAVVAGCLNAEVALGLVLRQARLIHDRCPDGGMTAVLADSARCGDIGTYALAGRNFATHFVISALTADLAQAEKNLARAGILFQRLPVLYPLHSEWIKPLEAGLSALSSDVHWRSSHIPFNCCAEGRQIEHIPEDYFWKIGRQPILFAETINRLEAESAYHYIDAGPSGTLTTFLKYLLPTSSPSSAHPILTPFGRHSENLMGLMNSLVA